MYRTGLAGYDETGQATLERLTELSVMRSKVKEAYGAKSPQYIAISKKCQIEMTALKEREARKKAEYKREQEMMELDASGPQRSFIIMVGANELVPNAKKMKIHSKGFASQRILGQFQFGGRTNLEKAKPSSSPM